jgi:hypothetical protein
MARVVRGGGRNLVGRVGGTVGKNYPRSLMFGKDVYPIVSMYFSVLSDPVGSGGQLDDNSWEVTFSIPLATGTLRPTTGTPRGSGATVARVMRAVAALPEWQPRPHEIRPATGSRIPSPAGFRV